MVTCSHAELIDPVLIYCNRAHDGRKLISCLCNKQIDDDVNVSSVYCESRLDFCIETHQKLLLGFTHPKLILLSYTCHVSPADPQCWAKLLHPCSSTSYSFHSLVFFISFHFHFTFNVCFQSFQSGFACFSLVYNVLLVSVFVLVYLVQFLSGAR